MHFSPPFSLGLSTHQAQVSQLQMAGPPDPKAEHAQKLIQEYAQKLVQATWDFYHKVKLHGIRFISLDVFRFLFQGALDVTPNSRMQQLLILLIAGLHFAENKAMFDTMSTYVAHSSL